MNNQPRFWLQVRKDYVLDNFESLVNYLRNYNYDIEHGSPDYDSSLRCMIELCEEISENVRITPLGERLQLPCDNTLALRLVCSTLLAQKTAGQQVRPLMLTLCSLLLHLGVKMDTHRIYEIIIACLRKRKVTSLGFKWENVALREGEEFNANFLALAFCRCTFGLAEGDAPMHYVENRGLFLVPPKGVPVISVVNREDYKRGRSELQFRLADYVAIHHRKGEALPADSFAELTIAARRILSDQQKMKPSLMPLQKQYTVDDVFPVRVIQRNGSFLMARTIDAGYEQIEGKLLIDFECRIDRPSPLRLRDMVKDGDVLLVYLSCEEGFAFETHSSFEDYYRSRVVEYADCVVDAIGIGSYPKGLKWVTRDGIRLCVDRSKVAELDEESQEIYAERHDIGLPTQLRLYVDPPRIDAEQFNVYAYPCDDFNYQWSREPEFFRLEDADRALLQGFLEHSAEVAMELPEAMSFIEMNAAECVPAVHLFHHLALEGDTSSRYRFLFGLAAAILAEICGMQSYRSILVAELDYLSQLAAFAANGDPGTMSVPEALKTSAAMYTRKKTIETLMRYRRPDPSAVVPRAEEGVVKPTEEEILQKVQALVEASNNLIGILDIDELDNIKRVMSRLLGMADEYESIVETRTFYGRENVALEFKSSVVYPPAPLRRDPAIAADPEMQKWVLLRTVCGFLNSRSGGDLLVGVNDAGYASGLSDDLTALCRKGLIPHPDMDHYVTYIQNMLDVAFRFRGKSGYDKDIARAHIEVTSERNSEERDVVRIHIRPVRKKGIVEFSDFSPRPKWASSSYVRQNARTTPLTDAIEESL